MFSGYSSTQKEILCGLDLGKNPDGLAWQQELAGELADQIENDVEHTLYNPDKVDKYRKQAGWQPKKKDEDGNYDDPNDNYYYFKPESVHKVLGWFTSIRLFFVRFNRVMKLYGLGFLPKFFDVLGLSYIFELLLDVIDISVSTFLPLRNPEKQLIKNNQATLAEIYWWRFKNKITQEEDLIARMCNAAVWFSINLSAFILTGGFSSFANLFTLAPAVVPKAVTLLSNKLNIGGFGFDLFLETFRGIKDYFQHSNTAVAVQTEINELIHRRNNYLERSNCLPGDKQLREDKVYQKLESKIKSRQLVKQKLEEKISSNVVPSRLYTYGVTVVIVVGMALALFPPTSVAGICMMVGGFLALSGSVFGGLGRRLRNLFCPCNSDKEIELESLPPSSLIVNENEKGHKNHPEKQEAVSLPTVPISIPKQTNADIRPTFLNSSPDLSILQPTMRKAKNLAEVVGVNIKPDQTKPIDIIKPQKSNSCPSFLKSSPVVDVKEPVIVKAKKLPELYSQTLSIGSPTKPHPSMLFTRNTTSGDLSAASKMQLSQRSSSSNSHH